MPRIKNIDKREGKMPGQVTPACFPIIQYHI
jgi:hypothetical protein